MKSPVAPLPSAEEFPHLSPVERKRVRVLRTRLNHLTAAEARALSGGLEPSTQLRHEIASVAWAVEFIRISPLTPPVHGYITDTNPEPEL